MHCSDIIHVCLLGFYQHICVFVVFVVQLSALHLCHPVLTWTLVLSLKFEVFFIIYRCKLPCKYLFRLIKLSCKKRFVLADFCLLLGSNQGYLGVNQMCGDDDRKVKLRIWRGDRQTETAGSLLPTYSVFYFVIVNNNIYLAILMCTPLMGIVS